MTLSVNEIVFYHLFEQDPLINFCPECKGDLIVDDFQGEMKCRICGIVTSEKLIDPTGDRRIYDKHQREIKARTGPLIDPIISKLSLSTTIRKSEVKNQDLKRIFRWDNWSQSSYLKRLKSAFIEIKRICENLCLPKYVRDSTMLLFKKASTIGLVQGRSVDGMIAACIYYYCRMERFPLLFNEIVEQSCSEKSQIKMCYKVLVQTLKLHPLALEALHYIARFVSDLGFKFIIEKKVKECLFALPKQNLIGKNPVGICMALIYIIAKQEYIKVSQDTLSELSGISKSTIGSLAIEFNKILYKCDIKNG